MTRKISFIARSPPTRKDFRPCPYLQDGTKCATPSIGFSCTECLLARINAKLDSTAELQVEATKTWIDFVKIIMKEIKKDRRKKP